MSRVRREITLNGKLVGFLVMGADEGGGHAYLTGVSGGTLRVLSDRESRDPDKAVRSQFGGAAVLGGTRRG